MMSEDQLKVNLFVVGAMKAGTTSFVDWLSSHPQIYVPPIKEPHYFVKDISEKLYQPSRYFDLDRYFKKEFPAELHIANLKSADQYEQLYSLAGKQAYRVDASTMYLHAPEAPIGIKNYNPGAKIIILLRDPYKRMYSHYKMLYGLSREIRDFETVVIEELGAYKADMLKWHSTLNMSFYKKAVESYKNNFEHVMVIQLEDLIRDQDAVARDLQDFLGLDIPLSNELPHDNTSRVPVAGKLFYYLNKVGVKDLFSALFPSGFKQRLYRLLSKKPKGAPDLDPAIRSSLDKVFNIESPNELN